MPIIFSLGARLENLSLRDFQSNPTKIANALRQIRSVLKVDGLTCYFDPLLEAEALGGKREWKPDGQSAVTIPVFSDVDDLRAKLTRPDSLADRGRIPIACEVLRRLKVILKDEPALMVGVSGPFTLAAQLGGTDSPCLPPAALVEFAAEVTASVSKTLVEAGADVVLLVESALPEMSSAVAQKWWAGLLAPAINVIRFYEALPVVLLNPHIPQESLSAILAPDWECVLCPTVSPGDSGGMASEPGVIGTAAALHPGFYGVGPTAGDDPLVKVREMFLGQRLMLLTSSADLSVATDLRLLAGVLNTLRGATLRLAEPR
jgi:hypothetical protein